MGRGDHPLTCIDLLSSRAERTPSLAVHTFLADGERPDRVLTCEHLDRRARQIGAVLQQAGLTGRTVLLLYPPGLDFIEAFFGCLYAGAIAVPAYPPKANRSFGRLNAILHDAGAGAVISLGDMLEDIQRRLEELGEHPNCLWLATDRMVDGADSWRRPDITADTLAFLQYTSGSTGDPKGVMVSHGNMLHNAEGVRIACGLSTESTSVCWLPSFHDMGLITGVLEPLHAGFPNYMMAPAAFLQKPARWLQAVSRYRATFGGAPNSAYELCLRAVTGEQCEGLDLSSWTSVFNGAEPVRAETLRRFVEKFGPYGFPANAMLPAYGMAEATLMISCGPPGNGSTLLRAKADALQQHRVVAAQADDAETAELVGCGQVSVGMQVVAVNPETSARCADGEIGELWVAGPSVAKGYWKRAEQTQAIFEARIAGSDDGPYLRTGDLGYVRDGWVFVTGRLKDLIIIGGRNFYPQDVELTVECCHAALNPGTAAAFSIDEGNAERLVVAVEVQRQARRSVKPEEVFAAIRRAVAEEHELQVHAIALLQPSTVPKTSSGKIQRRPCREAFLSGELETIAAWQAPRVDSEEATAEVERGAKEVEQWLRQEISRRTGIASARVDVHEPFTAFGFGSLEAVSFAGDVERFLRRPVPHTLVYDQPSIAAVVSWATGHTSETNATPARAETHEAIAIVGMGCRFPGARNPREFWRVLENGRDCIGRVPAGRFGSDSELDDPRLAWGGFLDGVDEFDAEFFGLAPREVAHMDPQQRLLLEVAWETLEDAGCNPRELSGTATGVFVGISGSDYLRLLTARAENLDPYVGTGNATSIAANRLSYLLDLRGPSLAIDTACSSSLVALHLACRSLRSGECRTALAGGVNLILSPHISRVFTQAGMLAADGRCKTFAAGADGYVRGEGCGMALLKRLSDAQADGDRILAVIRGSAVNQDGRSNGLTAPNGPAQEAVIRAALSDAGVSPLDINYVEAHGTGTELGDPIEVQAMGAVLCPGRPRERALQIGSVKTNIGHLESAAGIAGLIKLVLSLQARRFPAHLHFEHANPLISWDTLALQVADRNCEWATGGRLRLAGLSSFGFGGTNAHVIVEEAPEQPVATYPVERPVHVLAISARSEESLHKRAAALADQLEREAAVNLADVCYTSVAGRAHFEHRLAAVAGNAAEAITALRSHVDKNPAANVWAGRATRGHVPRVAFLFTGQGSQYAGMGRQLFETQPAYRDALTRCDQVFRDACGKSLLDLIHAETGSEQARMLDRTLYAQPALFALEWALAQMWRAWGVTPAAVMGHSLGEYVAACVAGVFTMEEGLKLVAERARLMDSAPGCGSMLAVFAGMDQLQPLLEPAQMSIAAINGDREIVVSGETGAIERFAKRLDAAGVTAHPLRVSHAFHSKLMEPILPAFREAAERVQFKSPVLPVVSNLFGEVVSDDRIANADYWVRHVREPVRFAAGVRAVVDHGVRAFVELGPQPVLSSLGQRAAGNESVVWLPSLRRGVDDWKTLGGSVAKLYTCGVELDWRGFDSGYSRRKVSLPTYPFQRQRYWFEDRESHPVEQAAARDSENWLYEVRWQPMEHQPTTVSAGFLDAPSSLAEQIHGHVHELLQAEVPADEADLLADVETLCCDYVAAAMVELGFDFMPGAELTPSDFMRSARVQLRHERLFERMLQMLTEVGTLERVADRWCVSKPHASSTGITELRKRYARRSVVLELTERCGSQLAGVLRGEADPLQLLFPQNSDISAEKLYRDAPGAKVLNALAAEAVLHAVSRAPAGRMVRVLEIGAGTGGTTAAILPRLPMDRVAYTFTDVSSYFVNAGRQQFSDFPGVLYRALDISTDPVGQGFEPAGYDVVVAANVLHATPDLQRTLAHVRQLLAPGGELVLLEGTTPRRFLDLTFGLLDGWWAFTDKEVRPSYPLLSADEWARVLERCGFGETAALPGSDPAAGLAGQQLIVSQLPRAVTPTSSAPAMHDLWLVCSDGGKWSRHLTDRIEARGGQCIEFRTSSELDDIIGAAAGRGENVRGVVLAEPIDAPADVSQASCLIRKSIDLVTIAVNRTACVHPRVWIVTRGGQWVANEPGPASPLQSCLWGLAQVIGLEHPEIWGGIVDLDPAGGTEQLDALVGLLSEPGNESLVAVRDGLSLVPRLQRALATQTAAIALDPDAVYLITGGLGGAGLAIARWMVRQGARHVVLMGRRGLPPRETWDSIASDHAAFRQIQTVRELEQLGAEIRIVAADVADRASLATTMKDIRHGGLLLKGVIHAAGVAGSHRLDRISEQELDHVLRPKLAGGWNLHELTASDPLDFFVCFSSASSLLGADGQGHYAAANRSLDALAAWRRSQGLPGLSINWGRWGTAGMLTAEAHAQFAQVGLRPMDPLMAAEAMGRAIASGHSQLMIAAVDWSVFKPLYQARRPRPLLDAITVEERRTAKASSNEPIGALDAELLASPVHARRDLLANHIERETARVMGAPATRKLDRSAGFFELGMDSLMAVALRGRLQGQLDRQLPKTLAFEHPTIDSLAEFLFSEYYAEDAASPRGASNPARSIDLTQASVTSENEPIAIIGAGCRFPGNASSLDAFWRVLRDGVDAVSDVPADRWDVKAWYDPDPDAAGKMYTQRGGFVTGVDQFDPQFFGIAPREAAAMDPQHRFVMEVAWEALEHAGCAPTSLKGSRTGVFVGATSNDYAEVLAESGSPDAYYITGNSLNAAAGRVSYVLGLHGPSMVVDAACASSLLAVLLACRSLRAGESDMTLAGGVNLILSPRGTIAACRAKMLSPSGQCKTFDASADGFVRGEGCGMLVLKRLSDAVANGDSILAVIRGSAVGQDGASGGLTVPNASAQQDVIQRALADAGVEPSQVDYIEAHGTGTSLGDPIEVRALGAVFAGQRETNRPLLMGSVKTNIGHLESASGVAGLMKVVLSLKHGLLPAHLHLREVNSAIDLDAIPAKIPVMATPWPAADRPRLAGVSSFGASGTLVHIVMEESPSQAVTAPHADRPCHVLAISARTERALEQTIERLQETLAKRPDLPIEDVCATANAGRSHFEHRVALIIRDRDELIRALNARIPADLTGIVERSATARVAFAVDEHAAIDPAAANDLYQTSPAFKQAIDQCEPLFAQAGRSLIEAIRTSTAIANDPAVELALRWAACQLWISWGIKPAAIWQRERAGLIAGCIAGSCTIEDALRAAISGNAEQSRFATPTQSNAVELFTGDAFSWPDGDLIVSLAVLDWSGLCDRLAKLYVRGAAVDWVGFDRGYARHKIELPSYPFQRQRCWPERQLTNNKRFDTNAAAADLAGRRLSLAGSQNSVYELRVRADSPAYLGDHRVGGSVIMPATAYVEMVLHAAGSEQGFAVTIENMTFARPLVLSDADACTLQTILTPESDGRCNVAIFSRPGEESTNGNWTLHASATVIMGAKAATVSLPGLNEARHACSNVVNVDALYRTLARRGLEFGPAFRGIHSLWNGPDGAVGRIRLSPDLVKSNEVHRLHPCLLDACSQAVAAAFASAVGSGDLYMLVGIERLVQHASPGEEIWCYARPAAEKSADRYRADLLLYAPSGDLIATVAGLTYQRIVASGLESASSGNGHSEVNGHAGKGNGKDHAKGNLSHRLRSVAADDRLGVLESHVRDNVARILGLSEPADLRTGFFDLGMDSLSASELAGTLGRDLGKSFPATVLFEHSNAGALARYLLQQVSFPSSDGSNHDNGHGKGHRDTRIDGHAGGNGSSAAKAPVNAHQDAPADLDAMSTDEMAALFARMLDDLKGPRP